MKLIPIVVYDKIYVPTDCVDADYIRSKYTRKLYEDASCAKCEYRPDRPVDGICEVCPAYQGEIRLYRDRHIKDEQYIGLPLGDKTRFERITGVDFRDCKIYDKRHAVKFDVKGIKCLLKPYDYQQKVIDAWLKKGYGLLEAPPRSGKTFMALKIAIELGYKILFLADQHEFLTQFIDHVYGNEAEGIPRCTNIDVLEEKYGRKLAGIPKKPEDFENYQFMAMTYQSLMHEGKGTRLRRKIMKLIGTLIVDEVHSAAAKEFSTVVDAFAVKHRGGVSGTIERKDGKHFIIKAVLGPIVAKTTVEMLPVKFTMHDTNAKFRSKPKNWTYATRALARHEKRHEFIMEYIRKDIAAGRSIVIPVTFKDHMMKLVNQINKEFGKGTAAAFQGGGGAKNKELRKQILTDAKAHRIKVVVGIRRLMQRGLNVPRWDTLYVVMPISNEPNFKQESARIRTPGEKQPPLVRMFVDKDMPQSVGCARNTYYHMLKFKYKPSPTKRTQELVEYFRQNPGRRRPSADVDEVDEQFKASQAIYGKPKTSIRSLMRGGE